MTHAYPRRCETFAPKLVARAVGEREFADALENLHRLWHGLDDVAMAEFKELLRRYLEGGFTQREWAAVVHAMRDWRGAAAG